MALLLVFFFQAEDGIRDYKVTGVQTCALPISITSRSAPTYPYLTQRVPGRAAFATSPRPVVFSLTKVLMQTQAEARLLKKIHRIGTHALSREAPARIQTLKL